MTQALLTWLRHSETDDNRQILTSYNENDGQYTVVISRMNNFKNLEFTDLYTSRRYRSGTRALKHHMGLVEDLIRGDFTITDVDSQIIFRYNESARKRKESTRQA